MKALKILGIIFVSLVVLLVVLGVLVQLFFDPNDYKGQIEKAAFDATGRKLEMAGDIKLSLFPWLGVTVNKVSFANAQGFGDKPMFSLNKAEVRVKIMPLLSKEVEVGAVVVDGLDLNLMRDAKGVTNWQDLTKAEEAAQEEKTGQKESNDSAEDSGAGFKIAALTVGGIDIRKAAISWDDRMDDKHYQVDNVNIKTGPVALGQPVDLSVSLSVTSNDPALAANLGLSGKLVAHLAKKQFEVKNFWFKADATGDMLPNGANARLDIPALMVDMNQGVADMGQFTLTAMDKELTVNGSAKVTKLNTAPVVKGAVTVNQFNAKSLMKALALDVKTTDPEALTNVSMNTEFTIAPTAFDFPVLAVNVDQTHVTANAAYYKRKTPYIKFDVKVDEMDADRYLPPKSEESAKPAKEEKKAEPTAGEKAASPFAALTAYDVDGKITMNTLKAKNLIMENILVVIKSKDGVLNVSPANLDTCNGSIKSALRVDNRAAQPRLKVKSDVSKIQIQPLLKAVAGQEILHGEFNAGADLACAGQDAEAMKKTLNGKMFFKMGKGSLLGINLLGMVRNALDVISGGSESQNATKGSTEFMEFSASAVAKNGVVSNKNLLMRSPLFRVEGKGGANLPQNSVDYVATVYLLENESLVRNLGLKGILNVPVPIAVSGDLSKPSIGVDLVKFAEEMTVGKGVNAVKDVLGIGESGVKGLGDAIGNIFGGGKKKK